MPPSVRIDTPAAPFFRGQLATFTATATDPDNDGAPLTLRWALTPKVCQPGFDEPANWPPAEAWTKETQLSVPMMDDLGPSCVWVEAIDKQGAFALDVRTYEPLDHAPEAVLEQVSPPTATTFPPNTTFVFSAKSSFDVDPGDMARLHPSWSLKSQVTTEALTLCPNEPSDFVRCFTPTVVGDFVVQASISDTPDAAAVSPLSMAVLPISIRAGAPPIAEISLEAVTPVESGPYRLGSHFRVSAVNSRGANGSSAVTPRWAPLEPAPGSTASLDDCQVNPSPSVRCFTAEAPGPYRVGLTVSDAAGDSAPVFQTFQVLGDQPACIGDTSPSFDVPTSMTDFTIETVDDDLDPYPPNAFMQWFVSADGVTFPDPPVVEDFWFFPLDTEPFLLGETVKVRVEIHDRDTDRSNKGFLACGNADECTLPNAFRSPCFQRVTWNVRILNK